MPVSSDDHEFWDRVEHEMKVKQPGTWRRTTWMLRFGMAVVILATVYVIFYYLLNPANGYFFSRYEMLVHPVFWLLMGILFIIGGAYLRFRAMGPIVDKLKTRGYD